MIISKWVKVTLLGLLLLCLCSCETYTSSQPNDYRSMAYQDAVNAGIDPDLFVKQINQESGFNPYAVSSAGAIGIAQFMPDTANSVGVDPHDPVASLRGAAGLMASYINTYGSWQKALAAYNCGPNCIDGALAGCSSFWRQCIPDETKDYIDIITK